MTVSNPPHIHTKSSKLLINLYKSRGNCEEYLLKTYSHTLYVKFFSLYYVTHLELKFLLQYRISNLIVNLLLPESLVLNLKCFKFLLENIILINFSEYLIIIDYIEVFFFNVCLK